MKIRPRIYEALLADHLARHRQMAFVAGPRQVGKTTTCRKLATTCLDWDNQDHRRQILQGPASVAAILGLHQLRTSPLIAVFDQLHKMGRWKNFLKGFFDTYGEQVRILVTGSSRLDIYRKGGDSLMGRYFLYRMHPFSVAEAARQNFPDQPIRQPIPLPEADYAALLEHGGYPEPFLKRESRFTVRWQNLRLSQLLREDVRDLTRIQELGHIETLGLLLGERSGSQLVYSNLAREINVSVDTIRRWISTLCGLHYGFLVRPWFRNVSRALRKEPKWYLRDWSGIDEPGQRSETFVACQLLKAVEGWEDLGFGKFDLRYLRNREKQEVDFIVIRDRKPWFILEVKQSETRISDNLKYFQNQIQPQHAFQVVMNLDYVQADCFKHNAPTVVPARTFLSQLI